MHKHTAMLMVSALVALLVECRRPAGDAGPPAPTPAGSEWTLVQLRGQAPPPGAAARPATLALTEVDHRVTGFAGCNRIAGSYEMAGDSLHFGPLIMTRMACADCATPPSRRRRTTAPSIS